MPEGPSLIIAKENLQRFIRHRVMAADGYTNALDPHRLEGKILMDIKTWGKHLLLCFDGFTVRIHFMLFGSYKIDECGKKNAVLQIEFVNGMLYFYVAKIALIELPLNDVYDWQADVMSDKWSAKKAIKKINDKSDRLICDVLMDQQIFSGVGNIIKNEVLFRAKIHPASNAGAVPSKKLNELIKETVKYSFEFLEQRKKGILAKNWRAYEQDECPRDHIPLHKEELGKTKRWCYYCDKCQKRY
ncbi:endonuclease [Mucilaginibacter hurinus]|uniref:Endonuclease n=1 Tax=Mucilaginibacter hurinus TaxID=2201324 RepID=A0A367GN45_9SPHI|nr:endonuclease [Mucilaginibacter hurinus]RCH54101.1 endonuclease [Mucilaginibacter hurinus]